MPLAFPDSGLYVITDTGQRTDDQVVAILSSALKGGARVIQYRDKTRTRPQQRLLLANRLREVCHAAHVPFIINDDIVLARQTGADGVHLGKDDSEIDNARKMLGTEAIIGISCYASVERAYRAQAQGATYVAFGRFFSSKSKPGANPAQLAVLKEARLHIPVVAIGGITPENGGELLAAGAGVLAVIESISGAPDPEHTALSFQSLFT